MAGPTAPNELKQLPELKTNLQDLFCRRNLSFQDNRKILWSVTLRVKKLVRRVKERSFLDS